MEHRIATPAEKCIRVIVIGQQKPQRMATGYEMLKLLLARLLDGGQITAASGESVTAVKRGQIVVCRGGRPDIYLALLLAKFFVQAYGHERRGVSNEARTAMAAPLSRFDRIIVMFGQNRIKEYRLPAQEVALMNTAICMACNGLDLDRLDEPAQLSWESLKQMAQRLVPQRSCAGVPEAGARQ